ncbi:hypothetical protein FDUTEX481_04725 [Tolypothrix sp. PCC 7601]|nr:hypothetical protein FDUTEX481_04725 [Tolypothrix sp. PCC 7601]
MKILIYGLDDFTESLKIYSDINSKKLCNTSIICTSNWRKISV